ncbi:pyrimidine 5'-nucleotidase [Rhizobium rhizosphaerae]|uniref:Pyrimidine 5'-nucleotidase n=1 Tax=Xaviernesmea rhizosphaerae TaxID=1672749 RepID=A0ABX3PH66_9HYPH|nr:pyrimidine 5'-nucleotidase [Xaviernesmea rhizosphaerae]OQP87472.1 pyrimidine 5'-nucleotidase [Xaviernesmea rhizosphaerae]
MQDALSTRQDLFADFRHVDFWIFDLDNTLYPQDLNLMVQMRTRTYDYIRQLLDTDHTGAAELYERFETVYGTAFNGLIIEHGIDPHVFLDYVHDIDHGLLVPDLQLADAIRSLPGKRVIYTNGTVGHAENVLKRLGITDAFDCIFDIVWADLDPKPHRAPYERLFAQMGADPKRAAMFEDVARNLEIPHALGARTVLVSPEFLGRSRHTDRAAADVALGYIDHVTHDLRGFLAGVLNALPDNRHNEDDRPGTF